MFTYAELEVLKQALGLYIRHSNGGADVADVARDLLCRIVTLKPIPSACGPVDHAFLHVGERCSRCKEKVE